MNKSLLLFFFLIFTSVSSVAAPVYKVEILIFEHTEGINIDEEQWRELKDMPSSSNAVSISGGGEGNINELPSSSLNLSQARNKLEGSGKYRILYHKGWSQPVMPKEENTAAWIELPGVLEGSINLYKNRYLHINADLVFNSFDGAVRLNENRRLKSKELHYLDHPLFGLLVRVVKL